MIGNSRLADSGTDDSGRVASDEMHDALDSGKVARNYYAWLTKTFVPHLRGTALEHGAGSGTLSATLIEAGVSPLILTEPNDRFASMLRHRFADRQGLTIFQGTLDAYLAEHGPRSIDGIVSSNVLEHIRDDEACLRTMRALIRPGGRLVLYVPARPELYGEFDRLVGHHRRYRRRELRDKLTGAGFTIESLHYRNLVATLPWFWSVRLMGKGNIETGNVHVYDQYIFPVLKTIEDIVPPFYGLNLLAVVS